MKSKVDYKATGEKDNELRAPIAAAMQAYARDGALAFHTPGHKQGLGAHPLLRRLITAEGLREEVSLMEELDDLHEPTMCIKEAEELAAALYGADKCCFMINGTTGAIHTMLMGTLGPGDSVLVPRNAHRSMIGGIIIAGAQPVYMQPAIDERLGIALGVTAETVAAAIAEHPEARAVALVYPSYYGVTVDLAAVAAMAHAHGMLLLVDEAHGPHLRFSAELPAQALDCGADVVAQSTHKIVGSMTQTSMLFAKGERVDYERLREAASLLSSTSPNQLLLASLDIARLQLAESGAERIGYAVRLARALRAKINAIPGLWSPGEEYFGAGRLDVTKITVSVRSLGISGVEAEQYLRHTEKIQCELSDAYNVLFIISYADTAEVGARLLVALRHLAEHFSGAAGEPTATGGGVAAIAEAGDFAQEAAASGKLFTVRAALPAVPECAFSPREAFFAAKERVDFTQAAGCIAAEQVMFYPPGIPLLVPGDRIEQRTLTYIREQQALGLKVVGPEDTELRTLKVVKNG